MLYEGKSGAAYRLNTRHRPGFNGLRKADSQQPVLRQLAPKLPQMYVLMIQLALALALAFCITTCHFLIKL